MELVQSALTGNQFAVDFTNLNDAKDIDQSEEAARTYFVDLLTNTNGED